MRAWSRVVLGMATGGVIAFAGVGLNVAYASGPGPAPGATSIAPVAPVAPVTTPSAPPSPTSTRATTAATSAKTPRSTPARATTTRPTTRARSTAGCGRRAVNAGRYDSSCPEYQGYLDPGTRAGRGPTSGEIQLQYACEQGLVP